MGSEGIIEKRKKSKSRINKAPILIHAIVFGKTIDSRGVFMRIERKSALLFCKAALSQCKWRQHAA